MGPSGGRSGLRYNWIKSVPAETRTWITQRLERSDSDTESLCENSISWCTVTTFLVCWRANSRPGRDKVFCLLLGNCHVDNYFPSVRMHSASRGLKWGSYGHWAAWTGLLKIGWLHSLSLSSLVTWVKIFLTPRESFGSWFSRCLWRVICPRYDGVKCSSCLALVYLSRVAINEKFPKHCPNETFDYQVKPMQLSTCFMISPMFFASSSLKSAYDHLSPHHSNMVHVIYVHTPIVHSGYL